MQKKLIIFFFACILFSCKKENLPDAPFFNAGSKEFGSGRGLKNGGLFECSIDVIKGENDKFDISLRTEEGQEAIRENFSCFNIPLKVGTYTNIIKERDEDNNLTAMGAMAIGDGCVIDNFYDIDTQAPNYVKVTSIDLIKGDIKGEVDLRFNIIPPKANPIYASILHGSNFIL